MTRPPHRWKATGRCPRQSSSHPCRAVAGVLLALAVPPHAAVPRRTSVARFVVATDGRRASSVVAREVALAFAGVFPALAVVPHAAVPGKAIDARRVVAALVGIGSAALWRCLAANLIGAARSRGAGPVVPHAVISGGACQAVGVVLARGRARSCVEISITPRAVDRATSFAPRALRPPSTQRRVPRAVSGRAGACSTVLFEPAGKGPNS